LTHSGNGAACQTAISQAGVHGIGPRLTAALAYSAGGHHVSCRDLFGMPPSLSMFAHLGGRVSSAPSAVRAGPVKYVEGTVWLLAGRLCPMCGTWDYGA